MANLWGGEEDEGTEDAPLSPASIGLWGAKSEGRHTPTGGRRSTIMSVGSGSTAMRLQRLMKKEESAVFFDWDDTLFPTHWVRRVQALVWNQTLEAQCDVNSERYKRMRNELDRIGESVIRLLDTVARYVDRIFIITLARRPWVDISMGNFIPQIKPVLEKYDIKICYADEFARHDKYVDEPVAFCHNPVGAIDQEVLVHYACMKRFAMMNCIGGDGWRYRQDIHEMECNIINVGDSIIEQLAAEDVMAKFRGLNGHMKTIKLMDEPTCEELRKQLEMLELWMSHIVTSPKNWSIEIGEDVNAVRKLHRVHFKFIHFSNQTSTLIKIEFTRK